MKVDFIVASNRKFPAKSFASAVARAARRRFTAAAQVILLRHKRAAEDGRSNEKAGKNSQPQDEKLQARPPQELHTRSTAFDGASKPTTPMLIS